jgi:hypothetical protein
MLSLERCREILGENCGLDDREIERLRDQIYGLADVITDRIGDSIPDLTDANPKDGFSSALIGLAPKEGEEIEWRNNYIQNGKKVPEYDEMIPSTTKEFDEWVKGRSEENEPFCPCSSEENKLYYPRSLNQSPGLFKKIFNRFSRLKKLTGDYDLKVDDAKTRQILTELNKESKEDPQIISNYIDDLIKLNDPEAIEAFMVTENNNGNTQLVEALSDGNFDLAKKIIMMLNLLNDDDYMEKKKKFVSSFCDTLQYLYKGTFFNDSEDAEKIVIYILQFARGKKLITDEEYSKLDIPENIKKKAP